MSNASQANDQPSSAPPASAALARSVRHTVSGPARFVGFWATVALPFLYVPLVYDGFQSGEATVFVALLLVNAVAVLLGQGYRRGD
jgi:hypothetical protein